MRGKSTIYKQRGYAHFDKKISPSQAKKFVEDPIFVQHYAFYPFLHYTLKQKKYKPKETEKDKRKPLKLREIYYSAHMDRYIYQYYAYQLNNRYNEYCKQESIDECALAYRNNKPGKCNIHFANEAFNFIKGHHNVAIIVGDFTSFFDNLNHNYLKECLQTVLGSKRLPNDWFALYKSICNYSYIEVSDIISEFKIENQIEGVVTRRQLNHYDIIYPFDVIRKNKKHWIRLNEENGVKKDYAIPQGTPISGVFANVYMIEFDRMIKTFCESVGGFYRRYSDDFIVALPNTTSENIQERIETIFAVTKTIGDKGKLELKEEKTCCYFYNEKVLNLISVQGEKLSTNKPMMQFLGFSFDGKEIDVRSKTKSKNTNKVLRKIKVLYRMDNFKKKDGKIVHISFKSAKKKYGSVYLINPKNNKKQATYLSYIDKSSKIFKGEQRLGKLRVKRRADINRLINRVIYLEKKKQDKMGEKMMK